MKPFLAATLIAALVPAVPTGPAASAPQAPARYGGGEHGPETHAHGGHGHEAHAHGAHAHGCPPGHARLRPGAHGLRERNELSPGDVADIEREIRMLLSGFGFFRPPGPATVPAPKPSPGRPPHRSAPVTVPVRFHVLHDGATGRISMARIRGQIRALNAAHGGVGPGADTDFTFALRGVTYTNNGAWYRDPQRHERAFKSRLRRGGAGTLNLYSANMGRDMLGWSTFPWAYRTAPKLDGVVIHPESMPGGNIQHFNRGHTATHEIGHWLGLYHTFQDGCSPPGDRVYDTPPERDPTNGCPAHKDTCPQPGSDPIHNFMDYAHDECMNQFTRGQGIRMHQLWIAYRRSGDV